VGTAVMEIDDGAASGNGQPAAVREPAGPPTSGADQARDADASPAASPRPTPSSPAGTGTPVPSASVATLPDHGPRSQILSPIVRRLATEHGIDLSRIAGSGEGGRITRRAVEAAIADGSAAAATPGPAATAQAVPLRAVPPAT